MTVGRATGLALALGAATYGSLGAADCRQALAIGLDVSGSVDGREYQLQLDGLAAALESPHVVSVLLSMPESPVDISVFEWSGPSSQRLLQDWVTMSDRQSIQRLAQHLRQVKRVPANPSTGLGAAMIYGANLLARRPDCWSHSLDISGDGQSNAGPRPQDAKTSPVFENLVINGLVIAPSAPGRDLMAYYQGLVLHGIGAFAEQATGFSDYEAAMTRKLLRELQGLSISEVLPDVDVSVPSGRP